MKFIIKTLSILSLTIFTGQALFAQTAKTEKNLDAKSKTTFYSLTEGKPVKESENWDLAFNNTTIKLNSKHKVAGQLLSNTSFDKVVKAPETGYKEDTQSTSVIPTGSGKGWYNYDMASHALTPIEGKIILIRNPAGKHYKLEILSYYFDAQDYNETGFYTFKYTALK
ncbi:HmuY family protein [Pedobacter gandavensis]|uniref:HmuY family protein n=1 Tax=Pedobacter TaxID=84567 RepID=UPI001C98FA74|nr:MULTISPECIES: HmuY family protein [Pedobacter]WGQ07868.1 HmuY family protein [Pedobacter gandavensis]